MAYHWQFTNFSGLDMTSTAWDMDPNANVLLDCDSYDGSSLLEPPPMMPSLSSSSSSPPPPDQFLDFALLDPSMGQAPAPGSGSMGGMPPLSSSFGSASSAASVDGNSVFDFEFEVPSCSHAVVDPSWPMLASSPAAFSTPMGSPMPEPAMCAPPATSVPPIMIPPMPPRSIPDGHNPHKRRRYAHAFHPLQLCIHVLTSPPRCSLSPAVSSSSPTTAATGNTCSACVPPRHFRRRADLTRHIQTTHEPTAARDTYYCDYPKCQRAHDPFYRRDHWRDHYRDYHHEDLEKKGGRGGRARPADDAWYLERNTEPSWWRCSHCLDRVRVPDHGFQCPACGEVCCAKRRAVRMV